MLICTPGKRNPQDNIGNTGTTSATTSARNDRTRIFHLSGAEHTTVAHNVIYVNPETDMQMVAVTNWGGWAQDAVFRDNTFFVLGAARFGHEIKRNSDGTYELAPGWGPAKDIVFEGNRYIGKIVYWPDDFERSLKRLLPNSLNWTGSALDLTRLIQTTSMHLWRRTKNG